MDFKELSGREISRRQLLRVAGLGSLVAATSSVVGPIPLSALAASAYDETPEGFIAWAYQQRARAMTGNDLRLLNAVYDPINVQLLAFEKDRTRFFADLGSRWNNARILGYEASVALLDLHVAGSIATARMQSFGDQLTRDEMVRIVQSLQPVR